MFVSVSSESFGPDCTSRSRREHVTQRRFTTLKILFIYLYHGHAQVHIKTIMRSSNYIYNMYTLNLNKNNS